MEAERKLKLIEEIKQIEREYYLKKSKLASMEAMEYGGKAFPSVSGEEIDIEGWKKAMLELIRQIGQSSRGGNSVEEIQKERER